MAKSKVLRLAARINALFVEEKVTVEQALDILEVMWGGALDQHADAAGRLEEAVETLRTWVKRDRGVGGISFSEEN